MVRVLVFVLGVLFSGSAWAACGAIGAVTNADALVVSFLDARTATSTHLAAGEGRLVYDPAAKALKLCDGGAWVALNGADSMVAAGTAAGQIQYRDTVGNLAANIYALIDGSLLTVRDAEAPTIRLRVQPGEPVHGYNIDIRASYTGAWARELSVSQGGAKLQSVGFYSDVTAPENAFMYFTAAQAGASIGHNLAQMVLRSNGRLGLGVINPAVKLDVAGAIRARQVSGAADWRHFDLVADSAAVGASCDDVCGSKYCLGAYVDNAANTKAGCAVTTAARNCICVGR